MNAEPIVGLDLSKYIDTHIFDERPHIRGRRITVATLAHSAASENWSIRELAYQFSLSEAEVLAALLYYEEHQEAIEAHEAAYQAELDRTYKDANP